jgi:hypothetical protein
MDGSHLLPIPRNRWQMDLHEAEDHETHGGIAQDFADIQLGTELAHVFQTPRVGSSCGTEVRDRKLIPDSRIDVQRFIRASIEIEEGSYGRASREVGGGPGHSGRRPTASTAEGITGSLPVDE